MANTTRPDLPRRHANKLLNGMTKTPTVRFQTLQSNGKEILVGRMKVPTVPTVPPIGAVGPPPPPAHAFILRRYDNGAVSLTTMWRAAFPMSTEADEKKEMSWVKDNFDLSGNNGSLKDSSSIRLAGTWVGPELACQLAEDYHIPHLLKIVAESEPEPGKDYSKPQKGAPKGNTTPNGKSVTKLPTPSPTASAPKRRREASPAPIAHEIIPEPPRRSSRIKSPPPEYAAKIIRGPTTPAKVKPERARTPGTGPKPASTPKSSKAVPKVEHEPEEHEEEYEAMIDEEEMDMVEVTMPNMLEDVAEQKALIAGLKATMGKSDAILQEVMDVDEEFGAKKRGREEEDAPLLFEFKEPEVIERAISTNVRASGPNAYQQLPPDRKSLFWGVTTAVVAFGMFTIPNLF